MRKNITITFLLLLSVSIFASSNKEVLLDNSKEVTFTIKGEERTIHVPNDPQRIVVIGMDTLDIIDALGLKDKVVGVVDPTGPLLPHYLSNYSEVPSIGGIWGDDFEAIAGAKPDLIIASARTSKSFDTLSEIAPAVYFSIPGMNSNFKDALFSNIQKIAYIAGVQDKGQELINELSDNINSLKKQVDELGNPNALFFIITGKSIGLYSNGENSRYGFVFEDFGFTSAVTDQEIENEASEHGESISFEFISAKNPEYMLVIDRGAVTGESEATAKDTLENILVQGTLAGTNNNIIYLDPTSWYISNGGFTSTKIMIDELASRLK